ncbi:MAG: response regulator transcription factor [Candidatus Eisenbacteria bacterium]|uniref:Response regulator transcription factor n=1 Tax=Eiseniibacteriota bacterium TaxID=2212470 RepID=A0A538TTT5_UNCEI|nr:MAG: response regulator transcription factor [Candidatus Eisenbacteria bacterium]
MPKPLVLLVDDEDKTVASVRLYLEHAGFEVASAADGPTALEMARREPVPALVILDVLLPRLDGFEVCRRLREGSTIPIIMLTARSSEEDRLEGLELGADDYVVKPFSPRELAARVRAVLRRVPFAGIEGPPIRIGDLTIDAARHEATVRGRRVALTPREFRLLEVLARAPGRAFTRAELVERAFGSESEALDRTIDAHVVNLRRKIEEDPTRPTRVETVFGVGYRLRGERHDA